MVLRPRERILRKVVLGRVLPQVPPWWACALLPTLPKLPYRTKLMVI